MVIEVKRCRLNKAVDNCELGKPVNVTGVLAIRKLQKM